MMTFEEHSRQIEIARRTFNAMVQQASVGGFNIKTRLAGDAASIYEVEITGTVNDMNVFPSDK